MEAEVYLCYENEDNIIVYTKCKQILYFKQKDLIRDKAKFISKVKHRGTINTKYWMTFTSTRLSRPLYSPKEIYDMGKYMIK